jgi:hypothetical protein
MAIRRHVRGSASAWSTPGGKGRASTLHAAAAGFAAALFLALLTSLGIAGERVTAGSPTVAVVANAAATVAAIGALLLTLRARLGSAEAGRARPLLLIGPQLAGAAVGVALVHAALRASPLRPPGALVERPAQFVNDAVAVLALLAVVWGASARPFGLVAVVGGAALVTLYAATASSWHLDPFRFRAATVQQFVAAQFVAVAIALALFRWLAFEDR